MVAPNKLSVNKTKKEAQQRATFGKGGSTHMLGKGDRTKTATTDAAGEQTPAITSQKSKSNRKFAEGGEQHMVARQAAESALAGRTGKKETAAGSERASGGLSRPARPGRCGT